MPKRKDPRRAKVKSNTVEGFLEAGYSKSAARSLPYKNKTKVENKEVFELATTRLIEFLNSLTPELVLQAIPIALKYYKDESKLPEEDWDDDLDIEAEQEVNQAKKISG